MANNDYTAADITVLEGLEPVRKRPGMYIGSTDEKGLHHILTEIVDNSLDEAITGFADKSMFISTLMTSSQSLIMVGESLQTCTPLVFLL